MKRLFFSLILLFAPFCEGAIRAVIFDCDGVLVDSEGMKYAAWQEALAPYGVELSLERYQSYVGLSGVAILSKIGAEMDREFPKEIVDRKNQIYEQKQKEGVLPIPPLVDTFNWLKKGYPEFVYGVASSASKKQILCNLDQLPLEGGFDQILSGKEDLAHYNDPNGVNKPKPYIYLEMAHLLSIDPSECLVLEDSEAGVVAAKGAGCMVIALPSEWTRGQDFSLADQVVDGEEPLVQIRTLILENGPLGSVFAQP